MANVEHSTLSGADLHEPKGIGAAAANRVYLSNGAGSGSWTTVPASAITAAGVLVFQSQAVHMRDEVSSGTASQGVLTDSVWNTRRLNTKVFDDLTITLSGNQFTLAAGTYFIDGWCVSKLNLNDQNGQTLTYFNASRLRNITDSTTTVVGGGVNKRLQKDNAGSVYTDQQIILPIRGRFTIPGSKTFEIQQYTRISGAGAFSSTGGDPMSTGEDEIYSDYIIWKLS